MTSRSKSALRRMSISALLAVPSLSFRMSPTRRRSAYSGDRAPPVRTPDVLSVSTVATSRRACSLAPSQIVQRTALHRQHRIRHFAMSLMNTKGNLQPVARTDGLLHAKRCQTSRAFAGFSVERQTLQKIRSLRESFDSVPRHAEETIKRSTDRSVIVDQKYERTQPTRLN